MEQDQRGLLPLHESLISLSLKPRSTPGHSVNNKVLVDKLFTVHIKKIDDSLFKFAFERTDEKERIFKTRPWTFNGAHLILKEWPASLALSEISFKSSTFTVQIHGLLPLYLHPEAALQIGERLGKVFKEPINMKTVVAHRYLRLRVDIDTDNPLPAGFFLERLEGEEPWIQFKFERLGDFCYRCGRLAHITGKCHFGQPATIRTGTGVEARLYGLWLRYESSESLLFVNTPLEVSEQTQLRNRVNQIGDIGLVIPNNFWLDEHSAPKINGARG